MGETVSEELVNDEEYQALRKEVAAEIDAEESGQPVVDRSEAEPWKDAETDPEKKPEIEEPGKDPDPWDGVSPALKQLFDDMSAKVSVLDQTQARLKQAEHRIGALTNELHAAKSAADDTQDAPTKEQMAEAAKSEEAWETLKADFPEWATAIEGRLKSLDGSKEIAALKAEIEQIKSGGAGNEDDVDQKIAVAIVSYAHRDWRDVVKSEDYRNWLKDQPADVVAKANNSWSAEDAISVLDAYKESRGSKKSAADIAASRSARLKSSVSLSGRQSDKPKSEADMTEEELRAKIAKEVWAED